MADLKDLEAAFVKADEAGNAEDAQAFATEIKRMRAQPEPVRNRLVTRNALYKGAAGVADTLLNAPNNLMNLGKAAYGVTAGMGGDAPEPTPNPDFARRGLESVGLIDPKIVPHGVGQKIIDYGRTFGSAAGRRGLADLGKKFHASKSVFHPDPQEMARRAGQREVWLYIQQYAEMITAPKEAAPTEAEI